MKRASKKKQITITKDGDGTSLDWGSCTFDERYGLLRLAETLLDMEVADTVRQNAQKELAQKAEGSKSPGDMGMPEQIEGDG